MRKHEWRERSEEGEVQIFRATKHGGSWTLQSKFKGEDFWKRHDPLTRADILILQTMLERKYQRNRVPFEDLDSINKWLENDLQKSQPAPANPDRNRRAARKQRGNRRDSTVPNADGHAQ